MVTRFPAEIAKTGREENSHRAKIISGWAREREVQRLRSDRAIGFPENDLLTQWAAILDGAGIESKDVIFAVLDAARAAADRAGDWRNWSFLTLQIQLASERMRLRPPLPATARSQTKICIYEDPNSEWANAKETIRTKVGEIPFLNWFDGARQTERSGGTITIAVQDEASRLCLENEYRELIERELASLGIEKIRLVLYEVN